MNAKFLNEARELEAKWKGLKLGPEFSRKISAADLECQRLHNETGNWDCCDDCKAKAEKENLNNG